jgi:hypothetical protein
MRIPERAILSACRQIARLHEGAGRLICIRISNSGVMHGGGKRMAPNPEMLGITDLVLLLKSGPTLWVELKADDGRLSPGQVAFRERLTRVGHIYRVVKSVEEFESLLSEYGVPRLTLLPS